MSTNANGKRARDELIVAALATGSTYDEAAKKAGVSRATVARRMSEWEFRAHVAEERERIVDGGRGTLVAQALAAADVLAELAAKAESETVRWQQRRGSSTTRCDEDLVSTRLAVRRSLGS